MLTGNTSATNLMEAMQNARIFNLFTIDDHGKRTDVQDGRRFYEGLINDLITEARDNGYEVTTLGCETLREINVDDIEYDEPCSGFDNGCICEACTALISPLC